MSPSNDHSLHDLTGSTSGGEESARPVSSHQQHRTKEGFVLRLSLIAGGMIFLAVAIFTLPKIAVRSSGLKTRAEVRTSLWQQEMVETGRVARDMPRELERRRDVAIIAGLVVAAAAVVTTLAYVALRPRRGGAATHGPADGGPWHGRHPESGPGVGT